MYVYESEVKKVVEKGLLSKASFYYICSIMFRYVGPI